MHYAMYYCIVILNYQSLTLSAAVMSHRECVSNSQPAGRPSPLPATMYVGIDLRTMT